MVVSRHPPHGSSHAREALELVLAAAGYEIALTFAFLDDGVWQLRCGQDTSAAGLAGFPATFRALPDFDVDEIYVERESLLLRGLGTADLLLPATPLPSSALREIMARQNMLLSF